jgi:hypothetical protein
VICVTAGERASSGPPAAGANVQLVAEKKAVRPPSGYRYDPSGYGACFGAKWRLPGRAGAGRCRRTPEQGWG